MHLLDTHADDLIPPAIPLPSAPLEKYIDSQKADGQCTHARHARTHVTYATHASHATPRIRGKWQREERIGSIDCCNNRAETRSFLVTSLIAGCTPLHLGAAADHVEMLDILLAAGAKTDIKNRSGLTALQVAQSQGRSNAMLRLQRE